MANCGTLRIVGDTTIKNMIRLQTTTDVPLQSFAFAIQLVVQALRYILQQEKQWRSNH
jgi:hypothetical protein